MDKIKNKVMQNKTLRFCLSGFWDFEYGKSTASRVYNPLTEILQNAASLTILGLAFTKLEMAIWGINIMLFFFIMGYFLKRIGFYDKDQHVRKNKDPIMSTVYEAALITIKNNEKVKTKMKKCKFADDCPSFSATSNTCTVTGGEYGDRMAGCWVVQDDKNNKQRNDKK